MSGVMQRTAMLKYYGSIDQVWGNVIWWQNLSTTADLTASGYAAWMGATNGGMKLLYVDSAVKCGVW